MTQFFVQSTFCKFFSDDNYVRNCCFIQAKYCHRMDLEHAVELVIKIYQLALTLVVLQLEDALGEWSLGLQWRK